jgi:glutamine amidotransferase
MTAALAKNRAAVAIIDYGSGNLRSAAKAFERAAREAGLVLDIAVTADPDIVRAAERVVLPGVGAFADCMAGLTAVPGMLPALEEAVRQSAKPFFGICVGMQLLASLGREHGEHPGLGWIEGEVVRLMPHDPALKIPHMGWNALEILRPHPLFEGIAQGTHAYFVHSYHFVPRDAADILARTQHGDAVTAAVAKDNLVGTQFHPEKSQEAGLKLITNFLRWRP